MENNYISKRIMQIIKHYNLNAARFSSELGMTDNSLISRILRNENSPSYGTITKILTRFQDINAEWLIKGEGSMLKESTKPINTTKKMQITNNKITGQQAMEIRKNSGLGAVEFSEAIDVSHKTIYNNEESEYVSNSYRKKLLAYIGEDISTPKIPVAEVISSSKDYSIPILNASKAPNSSLNDNYKNPDYIVGRTCISGITEQADFAIEVAGNSMSPKYPSGAKIIVKKITEFMDVFEAGLPYVFETGEQRMFKYLKIDESNPDNFIAVSENSNYQSFTVPKKSIKGLWKVLGRAIKDSLG